MSYPSRLMSRAARLSEIKQWAQLTTNKPKGSRLMMSAESYAHWSDVQFLLNELSESIGETDTPATGLQACREEPLKVSVDPADFTDTIAIAPLIENVALVIKQQKGVGIVVPEPPRFTRIPAPENDVWNDAITKAAAAAERALGECTRRRSDIHSIRSTVNEYILECRKPLVSWPEDATA